MSEEDSDIKKKGAPLDLGLSELAEECDLQLDLHLARAIARRESDRRGVEQADHRQSDQNAAVLNPFEQCWQDREYTELTTLAEMTLQSDDISESIESRLWWVRAHLAAQGVPISILTAPLESAIASLEQTDADDRSKLQSLAALVLEEVAVQLEHADKNDQALHFYSLIDDHGKTDPLKVAAVLKKCIADLEKTPGFARTDSQKNQLQEYQRKLAELGVVRHSTQQDSSRSRKRKEQKRTSLAIFPQFSVARATLVLAVSATAGIAYVSLSEALQPALTSPELVRNRQSKLDMIPPAVERAGSAVALTAIFNTISEKGIDGPRTVSEPRPVPAPALKASSTPDKVSPVLKLEQVNTSGPIEPRVVYEKLALGDFAGTKKAERQVVDENFVKGFPGAGSGQGFAVYRYDPPRLYRVIKETHFRRRPSLSSRSVDKIERDRNLVVVEDLGPWLKVRRKDGEIGYVRSQDTEFTGKTHEPERS